MSMSTNERLIKYMDEQEIPVSELARKIGASRQSVSNWRLGSHDVPAKYQIRMVEVFPEMDARWLITGIESGVSPTARSLNEVTKENAELNKEKEQLKAENKDLLDKLIKSKDEVIKMKDQLIKVLMEAHK